MLWETGQVDLFSELPEPFSGTWPTSGMTRGGRLLQLPMPGHRIGGNECSLLLPTPVAMDAVGARNATSSRQPGSQHHSGTTLTDVFWEMAGVSDAPILPTPRATDGTKGDLMLPSAVMNLESSCPHRPPVTVLAAGNTQTGAKGTHGNSVTTH